MGSNISNLVATWVTFIVIPGPAQANERKGDHHRQRPESDGAKLRTQQQDTADWVLIMHTGQVEEFRKINKKVDHVQTAVDGNAKRLEAQSRRINIRAEQVQTRAEQLRKVGDVPWARFNDRPSGYCVASSSASTRSTYDDDDGVVIQFLGLPYKVG